MRFGRAKLCSLCHRTEIGLRPGGIVVVRFAFLNAAGGTVCAGRGSALDGAAVRLDLPGGGPA